MIIIKSFTFFLKLHHCNLFILVFELNLDLAEFKEYIFGEVL